MVVGLDAEVIRISNILIICRKKPFVNPFSTKFFNPPFAAPADMRMGDNNKPAAA
jgi:hypothetical protein